MTSTLSEIDVLLDSTEIKELPRQNTLDYFNLSYRGLSYSRSLTLHSCPRKFELDAKFNIKKMRNSVTFAYGHAVGDGVQSVISGESLDLALTRTILAYDFYEDDKGNDNEVAQKKSLWWAVKNIELFYQQFHGELFKYLKGWEVPSFKTADGTTRKASEISFVIDCTEGYTYEGHIDLILHNPTTNRYMVLELKTTGMTVVDQASFKNSAQALGYGVIVDAIANNVKASASYDVLYMVYKSRYQEIVPMQFSKTPRMRAEWLNSLIGDIQFIEQCEASNYYPHRGESCFNYFRPCNYIDSECHMANSMIERSYGTTADAQVNEDGEAQFSKMEAPDFTFTLAEIAERQAYLLTLSNSTEATDPDMLLDITTQL